MRKVYLAGPEVFLPDAQSVADAKRKLCASYGFIGVSPVDNAIDVSRLQKRAAGFEISKLNENTIRDCQLLIANLTPFRSPSADVGTAYELGFARGLGLPVFGYTNVAGGFLARTREYLADCVRERPSGQFEDSHQMVMEDFDLTDNLMLDGAVHADGSEIVVNPAPTATRFTDLAGFEECLRRAARHFEGGRREPSRAGRSA